VAKVRERLAVNRQRSHRFDMERLNLKKLKKVDIKEKVRLRFQIGLQLLEDLDAEAETIRMSTFQPKGV
jgi:hypothetical protein